MIVLALDTSMGNCSAAVIGGETVPRCLAQRRAPMAQGHAEALMPMVAEVMAEAGLRFDRLGRIAATTGPGSFTGVRIAIAAARSLALVTGAELWGTDSLAVMAARLVADGRNRGPFAIAVDARRDMLYVGSYDEAGQPLSGPLLLSPDQAAARLDGEMKTVHGSGAEMLCRAAEARGLAPAAADPDLQPDAEALGRLAVCAVAAMPDLKPLYLRPPDAKPQARTVRLANPVQG